MSVIEIEWWSGLTSTENSQIEKVFVTQAIRGKWFYNFERQ